ncbi:hypothetical protein [Winogradskyella schleiferi]|uniref:hypothetical protein n=1 Tax=Winogradskyella schleiferi TaxID=2686078 RepID=UPI0015C0DFE1|nr:hypothetical protein [Winogradskyella schleiferi]
MKYLLKKILFTALYLTVVLQFGCSKDEDSNDVDDVGGCYWNFSGGDYDVLPSYNKGYYEFDGTFGTVPLQINLYELADANSGEEHITIALSEGFIPVEGETITVNGYYDLDAIQTNENYETEIDILGTNFDEYTYSFAVPTTFNVELTLTGNYLYGSITGIIHELSSGDLEAFPFDLNFGVYERNSDQQCR